MPDFSYEESFLVKPGINGIIKNAIGHINFEYATSLILRTKTTGSQPVVFYALKGCGSQKSHRVFPRAPGRTWRIGVAAMDTRLKITPTSFASADTACECVAQVVPVQISIRSPPTMPAENSFASALRTRAVTMDGTALVARHACARPRSLIHPAAQSRERPCIPRSRLRHR
jgi:hypothetical protein